MRSLLREAERAAPVLRDALLDEALEVDPDCDVGGVASPQRLEPWINA